MDHVITKNIVTFFAIIFYVLGYISLKMYKNSILNLIETAQCGLAFQYTVRSICYYGLCFQFVGDCHYRQLL